LLIYFCRFDLQSWPLKPHSAVLDLIFESDKMRALASFQDLYVGLEPYSNDSQIGGGVIKKTAPAVFGLLAALELHPTNKKAGGKFIFMVHDSQISLSISLNSLSRQHNQFLHLLVASNLSPIRLKNLQKSAEYK
jgi:hypothetical protein